MPESRQSLEGKTSGSTDKFTIVSCSVEPFEGPWLAHQPLMNQMSLNGHRVAYVLQEKTVDEAVLAMVKGGSWRGRVRPIQRGLFEVTPGLLYPRIYRSGALDEISTRLRAAALRRILSRVAPGRRILYLWNPHFAPLIGQVGEELSVFHCHDYYPAFYREGSSERRVIERKFWKTVERADIVLATSDALYDQIRSRRTVGVHLLENGVDFDRIRGGVDEAVPEELRGLPHPIVAYVGRVNRKVDIDALVDIAQRRPKWSVVLMGPRTGWPRECEERFKNFCELPNTRYIEGQTPSRLPAYMGAIDVGLMNYVTEGTWTSFGFPLKMLEYFALGKPAVGTELPSLRKYQDIAKLVPEDGDWVAAVEEVWTNDTPQMRNKRIAFARERDWSERARSVENFLAEALEQKSGR
ncbi:MAG: glycosyltransferase [Elusimicrobia bacterium]|nr:glycosyltransferase [Elusimicrobiota bacterium]